MGTSKYYYLSIVCLIFIVSVKPQLNFVSITATLSALCLSLHFILNFLSNHVHIMYYYQSPKDLKIEKYGPCPDYESNAIQYDGFTVEKHARNVYIINANINMTRTIRNSLTVNIIFLY